MPKNVVDKLIDLFTKNATSEKVKPEMDILKQELSKLDEDFTLSEEDKKLAKEALKYLQSKTES